MSIITARRGALALAVTTAVLVGGLAVVGQAGATSLYACVKKNGSARLFNKKPKCKKGETKLTWNSPGPAGSGGTNGTNGKNGTNGTNGTNGKEGAAGQPQKAVTFNQTIASAGSSATLFTLGEVGVKLTCGNFIANIATLEGSAPTGSFAEAGMVVTNSSNEPPEVSQTLVRESNLVPAFSSFLLLTSNLKAPFANKGHVNATITTPNAVVVLDAYLEAGSEPKACIAKGAAFTIPV
jgi:hypothetical protein